ncbi:MAG: ABC transporter ATP-binding protein [Candidatus Metalachnospira sp.]|nr:ABC transporter ATP-binding protein [Candidatus Metalachnospira sp.]
MSQESKPVQMGGRGPGRHQTGPRPKLKNAGTTIKRLLSYIGDYKFRFIFVIICIIISAVVGVMGSMFIKTVIDDFITPMLSTGSTDFSGLLSAIIKMGIIYVIGILATLLYTRTMVAISQGVIKRIRDEMFAHMQTLPIKYFDTHTHGDIMSHYTNDTDTLRQMLSQSLTMFISSAMTIIFVAAAMLKSNLWLSLFVAIFIMFMLTVTKKVAGKSSKYFVKQQQSLGALNGYIEEMINGQKVIKVFCHEDEAKQDFDKKNEELRTNMANANRYGNILMPIMINLGNLEYVCIALVGGFLALNGLGGLTLGIIASFLSLSKSLTNPLGQVSQQLNSVVMALAGAERIFAIMDEKPEEDSGSVTLVNAEITADGSLVETNKHTELWAWKIKNSDGSYEYRELKGDVRLNDVDFSYEEGKPVLNDISLFAKPGQKIAFVGATGAGKTTITNLINRFYDIQSGEITYDGIDIKNIKKPDLRHSLGIVLQDVNLFTGTIMDNIRYGRLDATDEEVIAAAKLANAHEFITMLPDGYSTVLTGDGGSLSQGQRQLISIARAAVADPPVMILDEATSSIDTRTESIVQKGMDSLMDGRTVFVIAHRLSTVRNSKAIMVLEHGKIIERGNHEELINQKGKYYQLYTGAFELE